MRKRILLAENKRLKGLYPRNGAELVEMEINDLWKELKQLKKETLRQIESTKKKKKAAYIILCLSWILFFFILFL